MLATSSPRGAPVARIPSEPVFLHRDDIVRDDQPDLSYNRNGGGWAMAGRSGKRDRRACNGFMTINIAPRSDGKDAQQIAQLRSSVAGHPAFR